MVRLVVRATLCVALALLGGGCAAATLATVGSVAEAASSAAITGSEVFGWGKLDTAEATSVNQAIAAARMAASDLGLHPLPVLQRRWDDLSIALLKFIDDKQGWISVTIERRTMNLVRIRIDVGLFGSQVTASLFLNRLRQYLPGRRPSAGLFPSGIPGESREGDSPSKLYGPPPQPTPGIRGEGEEQSAERVYVPPPTVREWAPT